jgi:hypothetical protein
VPALLSAAGEFITLVGRRGEAPGEIENAERAVVASHDSIWVIDGSRKHVYTPDVRWVRTDRFRSIGDALVAPDGRIAFSRRISTPDRAGYPLHIMRPDGDIVRSFGVERPELDPRRLSAHGEDVATSMLRYIVPGGSDTFWTYNPNKFLLERYGFDGRLITRARHAMDGWYARASVTLPGLGEFKGTPLYIVVESGEPDLLWLVYYVRNAKYRPADSLYTPSDRERLSMVDVVVEALDTRSMGVIATGRFPESGILPMKNAPDMFAFYQPLDQDALFMSYSVRVARLIRP